MIKQNLFKVSKVNPQYKSKVLLDKGAERKGLYHL